MKTSSTGTASTSAFHTDLTIDPTPDKKGSARPRDNSPMRRSGSTERLGNAPLSGLTPSVSIARSAEAAGGRRALRALPSSDTLAPAPLSLPADDAASVHSDASDEALSHVKPTPAYQGVIPAPGAPWSKEHAQVEQVWRTISNTQQTLRRERESGDVSPARMAHIEQCLAVDLATVAPGTAITLAPHEDIKGQYQQFRAAFQVTDLTLKDGGTMETSANVTMPALLRTLTEGNVFPPEARVGALHPYAFLAELTHLHAPNDAALSQTMNHLLQESPKLRADLGAVGLMNMEQQVSRDWQSYVTWIASAGWAAGMGYLSGPQEKSVRKDLGIPSDQKSVSGRQAFILGSADATTSGNSEAGDALLIDGLDKLSHNESPLPGSDAPGNMIKAWLIGTLTALPSSALNYVDLPKAAKILAGLPANLLAAIGGAAPLPMTRQKRNDHSRAAYVESIGSGMQNGMNKNDVGELVDASERVATMGQLLQKGVTWSFAGGFVTWAMQSGGSQGQILATMQRLLLNPMEAHALMGGGLLSEYVSFLGATRAQKNANLATLVSANAAENKPTSMQHIIDIHEPNIEKYVQLFGRVAGDMVNSVINGVENGTRSAAKTAGFAVNANMRKRIDYDRATGTTFGQAAGSIPLRPASRPMPGATAADNSVGLLPDLESGDQIYGPRER